MIEINKLHRKRELLCTFQIVEDKNKWNLDEPTEKKNINLTILYGYHKNVKILKLKQLLVYKLLLINYSVKT